LPTQFCSGTEELDKQNANTVLVASLARRLLGREQPLPGTDRAS